MTGRGSCGRGELDSDVSLRLWEAWARRLGSAHLRAYPALVVGRERRWRREEWQVGEASGERTPPQRPWRRSRWSVVDYPQVEELRNSRGRCPSRSGWRQGMVSSTQASQWPKDTSSDMVSMSTSRSSMPPALKVWQHYRAAASTSL